MSRKNLEVQPIDQFDKRLDTLIDSIRFLNKRIVDIDNKLGKEGLVNIDKFYNITEVAKMVGLSSYVINKDIKDGKLKPLKRGGRRLFNKAQIDSYKKD